MMGPGDVVYVGTMPVRRYVLIICVSAGKRVAWRRCEGNGSRGHVLGCVMPV